MKRLTTNDTNHIFAVLNLFYAEDNEVMVRGGGPEPDYADTTLVELIRRIANTHNLTIAAEDAESLGDEMYDAMFDGVDTVEGVVGLLHAAAVQAAEMRGRLEMIEDILGGDYNLDRLRELVQADREGRCVVTPCKVGQKVKVDVRTWGNVWNYKTVENGKFLIGEIVAITKTKKQTLAKIRVEHNVSWKRPTRRYPASAIGKTVFLTREEAALRREQDEKGGGSE